MGRQIRSTLPISNKLLIPKWPDLQMFRMVDEQFKQKQKKNFDRRHRAIELPTFNDDEPVFVATGRDSTSTPGRIVQTSRDRSYEVKHPRELSEGTEVVYMLDQRAQHIWKFSFRTESHQLHLSKSSCHKVNLGPLSILQTD